MSGKAQEQWSLEEDRAPEVDLREALEHDDFWRREHSRENYFRPGLEYEDYAPAYCVGYVGQAQYGGSYDDAEKSLLSNWMRIKGDSRLALDEAQMAMRAGWDRAAGVVPQAAEVRDPVVLPADSVSRRLRRLGRQAAGWKLELEHRLVRTQGSLVRH